MLIFLPSVVSLLYLLAVFLQNRDAPTYFRLTKSKLPIITLLFLRVISVFAVRSINTIAQPLNAIILVSFEESRHVRLQIPEALALSR
jgi:hypothetical protein